MQYLYI